MAFLSFPTREAAFADDTMADRRKRKLDFEDGHNSKTVSRANPYTGVPYSSTYYSILAKRQGR